MKRPQQSNYSLVGPFLGPMGPFGEGAHDVCAIRVMCIDPSLAYALRYIDPYFQVDEALYGRLGE
jgi:hypothetical protein